MIKDIKMAMVAEKIENLKKVLNEMTKNCDTLYSKEIVQMSEIVDNHIVEYIKLKQNKD